MKQLLEEAKLLQEQIVADRRYLHQIPEVGMDLPESAAYIEKRLVEMGIESHRCGVMEESVRQKYIKMGFPDMRASTGVVATIGSGSPCILLRADFDALPMEEINDLPFCSKRNASHMCGHDTHAAMLLGAAKLLKDHESELKGTVKLMFQPGEEMGYGSKTMIDDGLLENPKVDAAMAIHIQGKGGHSSTPDLCVDPIMIANQIYTALNMLMTREVSPQAVATLSGGVMRSGTAVNIIPDTADLQVGLRTYNVEARKHVLERLPEIVDAYAKAWHGEYEITMFNCPCTFTDEATTKELLESVAEMVGEENIQAMPPMAGTEDFSYVAEQVPSTFLVLGAGGPEQYPHHNPRMVLDESVFYQGAAIHANCAIEWLNKHSK